MISNQRLFVVGVGSLLLCLVAFVTRASGSSNLTFASLLLATWLLIIGGVWRVAASQEISSRPGLLLGMGGVVLWYLYPGTYLAATGDRCPEYFPICLDNDVSTTTLALVLLFSATFMATYALLRAPHPLAANRNAETDRGLFLKCAWLSLILLAISVTPVLTAQLSFDALINLMLFSRTEAKPWVYTGNFSTEEGFWLALTRALMVAALALMFFAALVLGRRRASRPLLLGIFLIFFLFLAIDSGTRALSLLVLVPPMVCWHLNQSRLKKRVATGWIFTAFFGLILLSQLQLVLREEAARQEFDEVFWRQFWLLGNSIDFFRETAFAITLVPERYGYFFEFDPYLFATYPVPRFIWPDKPYSEIAVVFAQERWGIDVFTADGNVFPGALGQYYMSFGYIGPALLGIAFAIIATYVDRNIQRHSPTQGLYVLTYASYAVAIFLSFRYVSPGNFLPCFIIHSLAVLYQRSRPSLNAQQN